MSPQVFDPHISAIVRFVVDGVTNLVFASLVVKGDDSPVPTLQSYLLFNSIKLSFFQLSIIL